MSTIPGPAAVALPHDTRAPGAASSVEAPAETREGADSLPAQTPPTLSTGSATAVEEVLEEWDQRAAGKDRPSDEDLGRTSTRGGREGLLTKE
jgi:hypothetical protein